MIMTGPGPTLGDKLDVKLDKFEADLDRVEASLAVLEKAAKKKTVAAVIDQRANNLGARGDDADGVDTDADELTDTPPGKAAQPHRFETLAENLARELGVSRAEATRRARQRYPELAADYARGAKVAKAYADLVAAEIAKGCSPVAAAQRVAVLYPRAAAENIAKSESGAAEFIAACDTIMKRDNCGRIEAMRRARIEDAARFSRFRNF